MSFVKQVEELIQDLTAEYNECCHTDVKHATYIDGQIGGLQEALRIYGDFK